ncbi:hypothetical protein D3C78_1157070 [compost metagenome]
MNTTGNSSGNAATARVTALSSASTGPKPWTRRMAASSRHIASATHSRTTTRRAMACCSGVRAWLPSRAAWTIAP